MAEPVGLAALFDGWGLAALLISGAAFVAAALFGRRHVRRRREGVREPPAP